MNANTHLRKYASLRRCRKRRRPALSAWERRVLADMAGEALTALAGELARPCGACELEPGWVCRRHVQAFARMGAFRALCEGLGVSPEPER